MTCCLNYTLTRKSTPQVSSSRHRFCTSLWTVWSRCNSNQRFNFSFTAARFCNFKFWMIEKAINPANPRYLWSCSRCPKPVSSIIIPLTCMHWLFPLYGWLSTWLSLTSWCHSARLAGPAYIVLVRGKRVELFNSKIARWVVQAKKFKRHNSRYLDWSS